MLESLLASLIAGVLVLGGVFFVLQKMLRAESSRRNVELLMEGKRITLPLRLQAYERLILFLERISPEALVLRLQAQNPTNANLHAALIAAVRSEFEHNLSQQLYVSQEVWQQIVLAKNDVIRSINALAMQTQPTNSSLQLAQLIVQEYVQQPQPTHPTIEMLKKETAQLF
ncbi:hypothetical protein AGMMS4956_06970 [Bacteroidia bacterium]|nr:hypothetical protein AGMMS4956_06970 [Bacteroidia bacterium]